MEKELVIHANSKGVEIALLENKKLVEFHLDEYDQNGFGVGDVYLGRIKKINPSLNAAFVEIGHEKDAFVHYSDLTAYVGTIKKYVLEANEGRNNHLLSDFTVAKFTDKDGKIEDVLKKGDVLLFQITKEAISTKGPRLTCEISIPGRYTVLTPFVNSIGISRKIENQAERERLLQITKSIKPNNFGIIVRTNAEDLKENELIKDIEYLLKKWENLSSNLQKANAPKLLLSEVDKSFSLVRDLLNDSFTKIATDNETIFDNLKSYIKETFSEKSNILELYKSDTPLFETYDVSRQVKTGFGKTITIKNGAYLIIEHTEALHVVDVNSGPKVQQTDQDTNALNINTEAAKEIARQLRLRDIGGIIVIDFIDMKLTEYKNKIVEVMHEAMQNDKAKHVILPISKFGLMQITRQRVKEQINIDTTETNTNGLQIDQPLVIAEKIISDLEQLKLHTKKQFILYVHPFLYAYLKEKQFSFKTTWFLKTKKWIKLIPDSNLKLSDYTIVAKK